MVVNVFVPVHKTATTIPIFSTSVYGEFFEPKQLNNTRKTLTANINCMKKYEIHDLTSCNV